MGETLADLIRGLYLLVGILAALVLVLLAVVIVLVVR
jgi:hypothetical protein